MPSERTLIAVYVTLMLLLAVTAGSHFLPLGGWHVAVNMGVAAAQAGLIVFVFMNLGRAGLLVQVFSMLGLIWLSILFTLALADYLHRGL